MAMPYDDVTFTREKLYEEVWARPVIQVAKDVGVSDVALAKICRKLGVPVPPRGYWARVAAGYARKRRPLPPAPANAPRSHVFRRWRGPDGAVAPTIAEGDAPLVAVAATLEAPHRLIRTSRAHVQRLAKDYTGRSRPREPVLDVAVSEASVDRALRVMDALLKALEARGHRVEVRAVDAPSSGSSYARPDTPPDRWWQTVTVVEATAVEFSLAEDHETVTVQPPPPDGLRQTQSWLLPRPVKERIPNGRLILAIHDSLYTPRQTCGDTKRQPLEARLGTFILMLEAMAAAVRAEAIEAARRREEWRREEERRRLAEERRRREEALVKDLDRRLDLWVTAARYREFAEAVLAQTSGDTDPASRARWVAWARAYADRVEQAAVRDVPDPRSDADSSSSE